MSVIKTSTVANINGYEYTINHYEGSVNDVIMSLPTEQEGCHFSIGNELFRWFVQNVYGYLDYETFYRMQVYQKATEQTATKRTNVLIQNCMNAELHNDKLVGIDSVAKDKLIKGVNDGILELIYLFRNSSKYTPDGINYGSYYR